MKFFRLIVLVGWVAVNFLSINALAENEPEYAADCKKAEAASAPKSDMPSEAEIKALKGCKSDVFYYGIGRPVDMEKARKCAFAEIKNDEAEPVFSGGVILSMIYANGDGVKKNLDYAIQLACKNGGAEAENEGRINHLKYMRSGRDKNRFDYCDEFTSGYMHGFCADKEERIQAAKRNAAMEVLLAKWPEAHRKAYNDFFKSASDFFESRAVAEIDRTGTSGVAFSIEERSSLLSSLQETIENAEKNKLPDFPKENFSKLDAELNNVYGKTLKKLAEESAAGPGSTSRDGIKATQRIWITYRDKGAQFFNLKYPQGSVDQWKSWMTKTRTKQLMEVVDLD